MTAPVRLAVDLIACDGRGLCAELLPELIVLDDWGYPLLASRSDSSSRSDGSGREVPAALRGEASAAVQLCPRLALRLEPAGRAR
jgi:ferredoxin